MILIHALHSDIFILSFSYSPQTLFTPIRSVYPSSQTLRPPRSLEIRNFGCISRTRSERWMAATSTVHRQLMNVLPTETVKVSHHKTVFSVVPLILGLFSCILDGRGQQQMHECMKALFQRAWSFLKVNTIWQMQDSHLVRRS